MPPDPVPDPAERIFHDLLDVPRDQREATLQRRCAGDMTLMAELRSLLEACEAEELFGSRIVREARSAPAHPGRFIGPYRLDSLIGPPWPVTVRVDADESEVAEQILEARHSSVIVIDDDGRPVGRVFADDVLDALVTDGGRLRNLLRR